MYDDAAGYLFVSQTLHSAYLESILGLSLGSASEIILFYLLYSLLLVILKSTALVSRLVKKEETAISKQLEASVGHSLFKVTSIVSLFILSSSLGAERSMSSLCLAALWVLVAELNLIFCSLLPGVAVVESLSLFGSTIEALVVCGQVGSWLFAFDLFTLL